MILRTPARQAQLLRAQEEVSRYRGMTPGTGFYERKLRAAWERARQSHAYRELGDYTPAALSALPVTAKEALKGAPWDYVTAGIDDAAKYYETTGSSGRVTPTPRLAEDIIWNTVSVAEGWRELLGPDDRALILLPSDVVPVGDLVAGVYEYLDLPHTRAYPFTTGINDWDRLAGLWASFHPTTLYCAPGLALQLTRLLRQRGSFAELAASVRTLMLLGEVNTVSLRDRLSRVWRAQVYDASYGSTETGTLAVACSAGRQHLLTTANYFEVSSSSGPRPLEEADRGRLVVTPLNLFARPLLRLDTGDEVTVARDCCCGNDTATVAVEGRTSDAIWLRGVRLSARSVEEVVYAATDATGYLVETSPAGDYCRLMLERDVEWRRDAEPAMRASLQRSSQRALGLSWDDVVFVNNLPVVTKSGASQKSWKRSSVRTVETVR
jgi:phenylacetate-CoA ligase